MNPDSDAPLVPSDPRAVRQEAHVVLGRRKHCGRYEYEIAPGRWVSRQRVHQLGMSAPRVRASRTHQQEREERERARVARIRDQRVADGRCAVCGAEPLVTRTLGERCRKALCQRVARLRANP